ncbi:hypothetical protein SAMN05444920_109356 [Nonomuraea solani]|uniref:Uncharacterized protein n=1 Tax=Nonomuraea solani TaxID=1144553 RepID=A0A1H6EGF2_9ACTN|nr:hypothetical protein [Nonomuraea solani]SEG96351.1 hypothetical protein SAMN05444920_109356 [Nonomuraea solani]
MPTRQRNPCTTLGCAELTSGGHCPTCAVQAEQQRGTAADRGYDSAHRNRFRRTVSRPGIARAVSAFAVGTHNELLAAGGHARYWRQRSRAAEWRLVRHP